MMRRTHAAAGLLIGVSAAAYQSIPISTAIPLIFLCQVAATLPDIDLKIGLQHRGLTHSLLAMLAIAAIGVWFDSQLQHSPFCFVLIAGYASHLFLDMLTVSGIRLFYPSQRRSRLLKLRTGSVADSALCVCALCAALVGFLAILR